MNMKDGGQKNFNKGSVEQKLLGAPHMDKDNFELTPTWLAVSFVLAIVALGGGWMLSRHHGQVASDKAPELGALAPLGQTAAVGASDLALTIKDQAAGTQVQIAKMTLTKTSWVAVRDAKTHWVLGARRFDAGTASGEVFLLRATTKGSAYEGVIFTDDGDKAFDLHKDTLEVGVSSPFSAQ